MKLKGERGRQKEKEKDRERDRERAEGGKVGEMDKREWRQKRWWRNGREGIKVRQTGD